MGYNPAGPVHLMMRGPTADERIAHAKRARYLTTTTVDDVRLAARLHAEAGVPYSIARIWAFEPHANTQDEAAVRAYANARYDDLLRLRDAAQNANVLFQVNNEQGFRHDDFLMYACLIERAMRDTQPVGMVFWNGATGAFSNGYWNGHGTQYVHAENAWTHPAALRFLKAMHAGREVRLPSGAYAFLLGVHNYSCYYPLIAVNAGQQRKTQRDRWNAEFANGWDAHDAFLRGNKRIDWRLPQDHIGREVQAVRHALHYSANVHDGLALLPTVRTPVGSDGRFIDCPHIIATECGADAMHDVIPVHLDQYVASASAFGALNAQDFADIQQQPAQSYEYALALGVSADALEEPYLMQLAAMSAGPRGYRTLEKTWAQPSWFPGKAAGEVLAYWHRWTWEVIYKPTGCVLGMNPFCEGDSGGWDTFNVHGDGSYHAAMEGWQVSIPEQWLGTSGTGEPGQEPIVEYREVVVELVNLGTSNGVNVRQDATSKSAKVGYMKLGETRLDNVGVKPAVKGEDIGGGRGDLWIPVRFDGPVGPVEGHVHAHYLKLPPSEDPADPTPDEIKAQVKAGVAAILQEAVNKIQAL